MEEPSFIRLARPLLCSILGLLLLFPLTITHAAVHQPWVQHWDGGFPDKANKPVAMELDSAGNICIVGSAANSSNLLDYATFKYAPDGTLLWSARYGDTNGRTNAPRSMALDADDNIYVTGTSVTVKYSTGGTELWTAPYGGRDLSVQGTNLFVVGFSETNFVTAKLSTSGTTLWTQTYTNAVASDVSQSVVAAPDGGAYVAGTIAVSLDKNGFWRNAILIAYSAEGQERFRTATLSSGNNQFPSFGGFNPSLVLSGSGNIFVGLAEPQYQEWNMQSFDPSGVRQSYRGGNFTHSAPFVLFGDSVVATGALWDSEGQMVVAGWKIGSSETRITTFPAGPNSATGKGQAIVADIHGNSFSAGYVLGADSTDIAVMSCDPNGSLRWAQQYNGQANSNDVGTAVVVAPSGDIYVAGYSTLAQGGTEMVLIKYSEYAAIQKSPDGLLLQFPGGTGQQYKILSSTNLPNWTDIGLATTAPDGLVKFTDTNTTQHPFRFYQTVTTTP